MNTLLKNKRLMMGVTSTMVGLILLLAGFTYAWFTISGANSSDGIAVGTMDVTASLDNNTYFAGEPGINVSNQIGHIKNNGTVDTLVKLNLAAEVTIKSDVNGQPLDPSAYYTVDNDANVTIELQPSGYLQGGAPPLGLWLDGADTYMWGTASDDIYVAMLGNKELPFAYTVKLSGAMGNEYMGADVKVTLNWQSTQLLADGAIKDTFGLDDITTQIQWFGEFYDFQSTIAPFSAGTGLQNGADRLAALIEELPDCSFKTLLENMLAQ